MGKWKKVLKISACILLALVLLMGIGTGIYLSNYYHANESAVQTAEEADQVIGKTLVFAPEQGTEIKAGLIFYPGGKVQYEAYAPLMRCCAEQGILCALVHMPGNLAVLDVSAADDVLEEMKSAYPEVSDWYIGGHSLGGAMAASYISEHTGEYQGLVLLAAYSTKDLTGSGLKVLSIYGSEDGVLEKDTYEKDKKNLPEDYTEEVIEGGCHAWFGDYGEQKGDGMATIKPEEQWKETAEQIADLAEE